MSAGGSEVPPQRRKIDQFTATSKSYMQKSSHEMHQYLTLRFKGEQVNLQLVAQSVQSFTQSISKFLILTFNVTKQFKFHCTVRIVSTLLLIVFNIIFQIKGAKRATGMVDHFTHDRGHDIVGGFALLSQEGTSSYCKVMCEKSARSTGEETARAPKSRMNVLAVLTAG